MPKIDIHTHILPPVIGRARLFPVFQAAAELGAAIFVHPSWDMMGEASMKYPFPLGQDIPGRLIETMHGLDEPTRALLLYGNALEWLERSPADFGLRNL